MLGRAKAIGLGLAVSLALLGVAEGVARLLERSYPVQEFEPGYFARDRYGRNHPARPGPWRSWKQDPATGERIYDVVYEIDDALRRRTPVTPEGPREFFALFFADSYTYGEGVSGDQTIPYYVGEMAPRYRPYNYGFHAGCPSDLLVQLEKTSLRAEVTEPEGILIYTWIDDHVTRSLGTLRVTASWGSEKPYYAVSDDGTVEFRGTFEEGRPLRNAIYRALGASRLLMGRGFDWPRIGDPEIESTARILARARDLFEAQFPGSRFVVAIYPGQIWWSRALVRELERLGVSVLDLSGLFDIRRPELSLSASDSHPSPLANELYARALVDGLHLDAPR